MTHCERLVFVGLSFIAGMTAAAVAGNDWPQFRGPNGDGISAAKDLPLTWGETTNVVWKTAIPGRGRSSPVILGDRIWLTTAIETNPRKERVGPDPVTIVDHVEQGVVCLDRATGKQLYHMTLFRADNPAPVHQLNSYATPTPIAEPNRLYCDFGAFGTACLDAETGKVLWQRELKIDHQVGPGSSPVIHKDLLILMRDGRDEQYVAALDKRTGKPVWRTDRPPIIAEVGNLKKSFGTPVFVESGGRTQMVMVCAHWIVSLDPMTGREFWRVKHGTGFSVAPRPLVGHGLVYCCTGMTRQLWAIRPDGHGDVTDTHVAWKATSQIPMMPSPLLVGREIYTLSDQGIVTCYDALTGAELGQRATGGPCGASPLYADGRIYVINQKGETTVLKLGKELEKLAENKLDGAAFASPAALGHALYIRTDTRLYCVAER